MGFGRLNDEQNPPLPLQDHGQGAFQTREGGAVDGGQVSPADHNSSAAHFMPVPLPNVWPAISSCQNMHGIYQSYPYDPRVGNNLMNGVLRHNHLQSPQIDHNFSTFGGGLRKVDACSSGLQNNQVNENVIPIRSNTAGGYQKNGQMGEAEGSYINWSQVTQSSLNLGCGVSMSHQNTSIVQAGANDNVKVSAFHAGKVDGSFLTLGIGSNPEARSKLKFDPQEVASKLEEAVGPKSSCSYVQPATSVYPNLTNDFCSFNGNPESRAKMKFDRREIVSKLEETAGPKSISSSTQSVTSVYPNFTNNFSSFNSNPVAFVDPMSNIGCWTSPHNDGVMQAATANSYFSLHLPEAFKECDIFENACNSTGFLDKSIGRHSAPQSYTYSQGGPPSSFPLNDTYSCLPQPGYTRPSELISETSKHTWITSQPTRDLMGISHSRNTGDVSSSFGCNSSNARGSSVTRDYLGISTFPLKGNAIQAAESGTQSMSIRLDGQLSSTDRVNSVHAFGNSTFPEQTYLQTAESSANKPATGTPFPRRLGVQLNDASAAAATQSSNQSLLSMNVGVQTRSNVHQSRNSRPPQAAKYLLGPISGHHQARFPIQSNLQTPSISTGQLQQLLPPQISIDHPRVMHTSGQVLTNRKAGGPSQVYDRGDQQSLKRRANEPPAVLSWGQKKRFVTVPHHSKVGMPTAPSTPAQIRWTGFDNPPPPEPIGHRCLICKRDLSFAPEGLVSQPGNPPAVAVLPCGHTFHDHCLQIITPDGQAHDPPCIPCAIGET